MVNDADMDAADNKWRNEWRLAEARRLERMVDEVTRVAARANGYLRHINEADPVSSSRERAALRRSTLDLTRALAQWRQGR